MKQGSLKEEPKAKNFNLPIAGKDQIFELDNALSRGPVMLIFIRGTEIQ